MNLLQRRPSGAMVVAVIALLVALSGTGVAAPVAEMARTISGKSIKKNSVSGNRLKKGSVTGNRIKRNSLTGTQINESKLGKVPGAAHADSATTASSAATAALFGGRAPSTFQSRVRWAFVHENASIIAQSGGITVSKLNGNTGRYLFGLGESVARKALIATPNSLLTPSGRVDVQAAPCGTSAAQGQQNCGAANNDGRHVLVETADSFGGTTGWQDAGFYIAFIG